MLAANPRAYIRLFSASELDDPLFAVLAEDQTAVSEKLYQYPRIIINAFCARGFLLTYYPHRWAMGGGYCSAYSSEVPRKFSIQSIMSLSSQPTARRPILIGFGNLPSDIKA